MPAVFLSTWTVLRVALHTPEPIGFVWAVVIAQAVQLWAVMPVVVWRAQHTSGGSVRETIIWVVVILYGFLAFQIWWSDRWMSQRLVSVYLTLYATTMAFGVWGDRVILNRFVPVSKDSDVPLAFRRHLLKLYAIVAILAIAANETLLAINTPLNSRVVTLSLLPIVLHYFFEVTLRLTYPPLDECDT